MINNTYLEVQIWASSFLEKNNNEPEIAYHLMLDMAEISVSEWLLERQKPIPDSLKEAYIQAIEKIAYDHYPWQYIVGVAWFYGESFKVTPDTLIPRQETEELVAYILSEIKHGRIQKDARVLDIGTGTGIIPIILKLHYPSLTITATDISEAALNVAKENAQDKNVDIFFAKGDLYEPVSDQQFDLIISNPPYIGESELDVMSISTVKYEPKSALFAEDEGFDIYWRLFDGLEDHLNDQGLFIAEFGYKQGKRLLTRANEQFENRTSQILKDTFDNDRIIIIR